MRCVPRTVGMVSALTESLSAVFHLRCLLVVPLVTGLSIPSVVAVFCFHPMPLCFRGCVPVLGAICVPHRRVWLGMIDNLRCVSRLDYMFSWCLCGRQKKKQRLRGTVTEPPKCCSSGRGFGHLQNQSNMGAKTTPTRLLCTRCCDPVSNTIMTNCGSFLPSIFT